MWGQCPLATVEWKAGGTRAGNWERVGGKFKLTESRDSTGRHRSSILSELQLLKETEGGRKERKKK
jgi:hypothetical protein